jgi:hypothetical protein
MSGRDPYAIGIRGVFDGGEMFSSGTFDFLEDTDMVIEQFVDRESVEVEAVCL